MQVYEVVVGSTAKDVVAYIVDENQNPIPLGTGATARLQGKSADLPTMYLNVAATVTDAAGGQITYESVGTLLDDLDLGALTQATFRCQFFYTDSADATDYSEEFDITFKAPPIPNYTLTATFTAGSGHGITLSPAGGRYAAMTVVTVTVTGSSFVSWGGADAADMSVATSPATITMDSDKTISAVMS